MKDLCTPLSRLFSGDPQALFGGLLSINTNKIPLQSNQTFFDFPQLQNNQFLYVAKSSMLIRIVNASTWGAQKFGLYIMPPNAVGNAPIPHGPSVDQLDLTIHLGVEVMVAPNTDIANLTGGDQIWGSDPAAGNAGLYSPFIVPPGHFLRFVALENDGDGISAGSYVAIQLQSVAVPLDFVER